jgi:hypothetical protein
MEKLYTIYEACQHREAVAKGLRPSVLTMAVANGNIPVQIGKSTRSDHRAVYFIAEKDLLEFLEVCEEQVAQIIAANQEEKARKVNKNKLEGTEEYRLKLLKLGLMEEARQFGTTLREYLKIIDQPHLMEMFNGNSRTEEST